MTIELELGSNLRLISILVVVAVLVIEWWSFRLKGRR